MKLKIILIVLGIAVAAGSIWYIFNGGTEQDSTETATTTSDSASNQDAEVPKDSLQAVVKDQKDVKIFNELLADSGVAQSLQATGPFTVLAPTDDAFKALPDGVLDTLKKPENKEKAIKALMIHPLINTYNIAEKITDEFLELYKEYIGEWK